MCVNRDDAVTDWRRMAEGFCYLTVLKPTSNSLTSKEEQMCFASSLISSINLLTCPYDEVHLN